MVLAWGCMDGAPCEDVFARVRANGTGVAWADGVIVSMGAVFKGIACSEVVADKAACAGGV
jgi:hypothetical protein